MDNQVKSEVPVSNCRFSDVMKEHNGGASEYELSVAIQEVISAMRRTGKLVGSVTYKMRFEAVKGNVSRVIMSDEIRVEAPKDERPGSLFFTTSRGGLLRNDPNQMPLPMDD